MGYDNLRRLLAFLTQGEHPFVEIYGGYLNRETGRSSSTRLRATHRLWEHIDAIGVQFHREMGNERGSPSITGRNSPSLIVYSDSFECILLKDESKKLIDYLDDPNTHELRRFLSEWNAFAAINWIDIFLRDEQLKTMALEQHEVSTEGAERDEDPQHIEFRKNRLYRVFNNGSFQQGGRFYGGWWQQVPSRHRRFITINGAPTRELDFSNLQAAMLYAREGLPLDEDAYSIEGIHPRYRKLIKSTFFKLINAREGQRVRAPRTDELPPGWTWQRLQDALAERHAPIARYFRSGVGTELQWRDAQIAEAVMKEFMSRRILVLPIHDSFIAYRAQHTSLMETMIRCYRQHTQSEIRVDPDHSFADFLLGEDEPVEPGDELDELVINRWDELRDAPEYAGYNARKAEFLRDKDDDWMWEFGPL